MSQLHSKRWVIKAGSNIVCSGGPLLMRAWARQLAALRRDHGIEIIWVSSGAIAMGAERSGHTRRQSLAEKQALSAIGQSIIMDMYNLALQTTGLLGAQVLLTSQDLVHPRSRRNFANTIEQLLKWKVTPILNENDAMATEEIRFSDNDLLSAQVARVVRASRLVILTDVEGLYDSDPRHDPEASLIHHCRGISSATMALAGGRPGSSRGTGGMRSKLLAARTALRSGIETWLVKGDMSDSLLRISRGETLGTRIERAGRAK